MKYILIATVVFFASCSDAPFIKHELKAEKLGPCTNDAVVINVSTNIMGERFTFNACVNDDFDGKQYSVERKGDSLVVKFPTESKKKTLYKMVLDIDAKPAYHFITLGSETIAITTSKF
jgi:hypothetical protein